MGIQPDGTMPVDPDEAARIRKIKEDREAEALRRSIADNLGGEGVRSVSMVRDDGTVEQIVDVERDRTPETKAEKEHQKVIKSLDAIFAGYRTPPKPTNLTN